MVAGGGLGYEKVSGRGRGGGRKGGAGGSGGGGGWHSGSL